MNDITPRQQMRKRLPDDVTLVTRDKQAMKPHERGYTRQQDRARSTCNSKALRHAPCRRRTTIIPPTTTPLIIPGPGTGT